jgi:hypothetical protein
MCRLPHDNFPPKSAVTALQNSVVSTLFFLLVESWSMTERMDKATLSQSQSREAWLVIFRPPVLLALSLEYGPVRRPTSNRSKTLLVLTGLKRSL